MLRHIRSILYSLVLAPAAWVLTGVGLTSDLTARGRDGFELENLTGLLLLLLAGAAYGILVLAPISPAGPLLAGVVYLAISSWALLSPSAYADVWPHAVAKDGFDLSRPGYGLAALLAVPLICTALSARRWEKYVPPVLPLIGQIGGFRGAAAAYGTPLAAAPTTVIGRPPGFPSSLSTADPDSTTVLRHPADSTTAFVPGEPRRQSGLALLRLIDDEDDPTIDRAGPLHLPTLTPTDAVRPDEPTVVVIESGDEHVEADDDDVTVVVIEAELLEPAVNEEPTDAVTASGEEPTDAVVDAEDQPTEAVADSDEEPATDAVVDADDQPTEAVADSDEELAADDVRAAAEAPIADLTEPGEEQPDDEPTAAVDEPAAADESTPADESGAAFDESVRAVDEPEPDAATEDETTAFVAAEPEPEPAVAQIDAEGEASEPVTDEAPADDEPTVAAMADDGSAEEESEDEHGDAEDEAAVVVPIAVADRTEVIRLPVTDNGDNTQVVRFPVGDGGDRTQVVRLPVTNDGERTQVLRLPVGDAADRNQVAKPPVGDSAEDRTTVLPFPAADQDEKTQVIRLPLPPGDTPQVLRFPVRSPGAEPGTRTRDLSNRATGDIGGDETQVIRLAGKTVDDEKTQVIRPALVTRPGERSDVLAFRPPAPRDEAPISIADAEAPNFADDPTSPIILPTAHHDDDPAESHQRTMTVMNMERPPDDNADDTTHLEIPTQRRPQDEP
ncbi:hypothetical protein [Paractinoplanes globisporus]|uniref:Uncharacterized protein n=1 Tax=Paractinoplanes globisporus TaxID=113565 RepID=A0ABW6WES1_9ACTN